MPDILIRGMEMPHIHDTVRFAMDYGSGKMIAINQYEDNPTWHFVEELPPHGDLIDRDRLKHKFCTHCDGYEYDTNSCVDGDQDCMGARLIMNGPSSYRHQRRGANDRNH